MAIEQAIAEVSRNESLVSGLATAEMLHPSSVSKSDAPPTFRLDLLGSPQAFLAEHPIVLRTRKTLALLAYLALQGGRQPREHLADLFWPEADIDDARASLRTTLSYVRQALGSDADAYLTSTREFVGLHPSGLIDLDVQRLTETQQLVRRTPDCHIFRHQIENAAARYRGTFLANLSLPDAPEFEAWLEGQRVHWRGVVAELLEHLAALQLQDGDTGAALSTLERWIAVDPDDESAWREVIELHLRTGDRAGARRAWQRYLAVLAELGADPGPEMTTLVERLDGPAAAALIPTGADTLAGPRDLDVRCLPLVGRAQEWSALRAAFERSRLGHPEVAIVEGVPGVGKTRLVSQFAQTAKGEGADVIVGRALETVGDLPYGAVVDALRVRLDEENAPDDLLSDLWLGELARLVPELRERYPDLPVSMDDPALARGRLFEAVARLGQALGDRRPLVLCLDDVQWADVATRDLLRYAIQRWTDSRTPVLLILVVRSEDRDMDMGLKRWLNALERDAPTLQLSLESLQRDHVVALLAQLAGSSLLSDEDHDQVRIVTEFATWLIGRTGGHPLSITQAMYTLLEDRVLPVRPADGGVWMIDVPDLRHAKHTGRLDSIGPAGSEARTASAGDRFARSRTTASPHGRVIYPTAALHATHSVVSVA